MIRRVIPIVVVTFVVGCAPKPTPEDLWSGYAVGRSYNDDDRDRRRPSPRQIQRVDPEPPSWTEP